MKIEDKIKRLIDKEYIYIYNEMDEAQMLCIEYCDEKRDHSCISKDGVSYTITTRIDNQNYYIIDDMSRNKDESKVWTTKDKLLETLNKNEKFIEEMNEAQFLDLYNQTLTKDGVSGSIHTRINAGNYWYVMEKKEQYSEESINRIMNNVNQSSGDVCPTITANAMQSVTHNNCVIITESVDLKRGYSCEVKQEASETDDVDVIGNYSKSGYNQTSIVGKNGIAPTVTENHGQVTAVVERVGGLFDTEDHQNSRGYIYNPDGLSPTLNTCGGGYAQPMVTSNTSNLAIRRLTPKECYRLMGFSDLDCDRAAEVISESMLFHTAGDSIVVNVLMAIIGEML